MPQTEQTLVVEAVGSASVPATPAMMAEVTV